MTHSATARLFLKLNSQYSALCGLVLVAAAGALSPMIFAQPADWVPGALRLLGGGLLGFAALLYVLAKNRFVSRASVHEIVLLDVLWVIASIVTVAFFGPLLTTTGISLVTIVAMVVAFFAIAQFAGAAKIVKPRPVADVSSRNGDLIATVKREAKAPIETVWEVMTDHPAYADVASNITKVEVLAGEGIGMTRRCHGPKGESWEETCDLFVPGRAFGFRIHTEAEDYPYPLSALSGKWLVKPVKDGSEFSIEITATPKGNALARWVFTMIAKHQFKAVLIDLADAWATRMEGEARG